MKTLKKSVILDQRKANEPKQTSGGTTDATIKRKVPDEEVE
jgi:hypothetical protein